MAMNGNSLGNEIAVALEAVTGAPLVGTEGEAMWKAIAGAIVKHIQSNGVVNTTVTTPNTINGTGVGTVS